MAEYCKEVCIANIICYTDFQRLLLVHAIWSLIPYVHVTSGWVGHCWLLKENHLIWQSGPLYPYYLGLNNVPICTVNDDENSLGTLSGVGQFNYLEKDEMPSAKCSNPPSTAPLEGPVRRVSPAPNAVKVHPPRPHSGESLSTMRYFLRPPANYWGVEEVESTWLTK